MFKILFSTFSAIIALASASSFAADKVLPSSPELLAKGKAAFATNCVICHGEKGDGNGPAGMALNPKPRNFAKDKFKAGATPDAIYNTITHGLTVDGKPTTMVGFGQLSPEDRSGLVYYVLSFKK